MEVYLQENPVDLMIGSSDGRLISIEQSIPLIRVGSQYLIVWDIIENQLLDTMVVYTL